MYAAIRVRKRRNKKGVGVSLKEPPTDHTQTSGEGKKEGGDWKGNRKNLPTPELPRQKETGPDRTPP